MGGWWFELVILDIFQRTQTCSESNKITKKMQWFYLLSARESLNTHKS